LWHPGAGAHAASSLGGELPRWWGTAGARRAARERLAAGEAQGAIVVSAERGGGEAASWLPRSLPAWWWPTALGGPAIFRPWARTLEPLVRSWAQPMEAALPLVTP